MSLDRCDHCDKLVDTDKFPNAYPYANDQFARGLPFENDCVCENCQEQAYERQQEKLMEET